MLHLFRILPIVRSSTIYCFPDLHKKAQLLENLNDMTTIGINISEFFNVYNALLYMFGQQE